MKLLKTFLLVGAFLHVEGKSKTEPWPVGGHTHANTDRKILTFVCFILKSSVCDINSEQFNLRFSQL